jgi:hypothetical protein
MKSKMRVTTLKMDGAALSMIDVVAARTGIPRSQIIRYMIEDWLSGLNACGAAARLLTVIEGRADKLCAAENNPGAEKRGGTGQ